MVWRVISAVREALRGQPWDTRAAPGLLGLAPSICPGRFLGLSSDWKRLRGGMGQERFVSEVLHALDRLT
jgi:hypothetical protein